MKIRIEGTQEEIENFIRKLSHNRLAGDVLQAKSISKFYPNRNTAERMLNIKSNIGRVYIEVE